MIDVMGASAVTYREMGRRRGGGARTPTARWGYGSPLSACQDLHPRRPEARAPELEQIMGAAPQRPLSRDLLQPSQPEPRQASHTHLPKDRLDGATAQFVDRLAHTAPQLP